MKARPRALPVLFALILLLPAAAAAQSPPPWEESRAESGAGLGFDAWGGHLGLSSSDGFDQFLLGGHMDLGGLHRHLLLRPGLTLGFGDDVTTFDIQLDGDWTIPVRDMPLDFYAGAGLSLFFANWDGGSEFEPGLNIIGGLAGDVNERVRWHGEVKFGIGDIPDFMLLVGFSLHRGAPRP